jgi:hypothetical protein
MDEWKPKKLASWSHTTSTHTHHTYRNQQTKVKQGISQTRSIILRRIQRSISYYLFFCSTSAVPWLRRFHRPIRLKNPVMILGRRTTNTKIIHSTLK